MNRRTTASVSALALTAVLPFGAASAHADPTSTTHSSDDAGAGVARSDNRPSPVTTRQAALRQSAVDQLVDGDARLRGTGRSRTIQMADGTQVDYPVSQTAKLLTFLVDFGSGTGSPDFPDQTAGPVHNQLPQPIASDNSTYWRPTFDRQHYLDMFFNGMPEQGGESFRAAYREMSSGRFDLEGDVSDWVSVGHPSSYYSQADGHENEKNMTDFIGDSADAWFASASSTMSAQDVKAYLAQFDQWDRYDSDHDGNYNEPDGYIDHFQAIHAGPGEEAGGAPWTIWSHRSAVNFDATNSSGPACSTPDCFRPGGVEIGDTGYWIFDYTTEPEDGGLGVFAHEFGHDLGLPDYYDTDAPTDNSTGFWNLMSAGSWLSDHGRANGTTPNHVGAADKLFLGWYGDDNEDLAIVNGLAKSSQKVVLGPSNHATTTGKQAVLVKVPDGSAVLAGPVRGSTDGAYLYSGNRNAADPMAVSPPVKVPGTGSSTLRARVAYATEPDFDYAYLAVSDDGGKTWDNVATSASTDADPNHANLGHGITGGTGKWRNLTADLSAYAGKTVRLRWDYLTDGASLGALGLAVDRMAIGKLSTGFTSVKGWHRTGFHRVRKNSYTITYSQAYIAENRQYRGYDSTLASGPYNWGHQFSTVPFTKSDRYALQDGLLVWYLNGRYSDNNTSAHPGGGQALPVDANPAVQVWRTATGKVLGAADPRLQSFDATFDVDRTAELRLGMETSARAKARLRVPAHRSVPVFEDSRVNAYYDTSVPGGELISTKVGGTGAEIQVLSSDERTGRMVLRIGRKFIAAVGATRVVGKPSVGTRLRARAPWFQRGVTTTYRWLRDGRPIEGADQRAYVVRPVDRGHRISVRTVGTKRGYRLARSTSEATVKVRRGRH